jgi:hypothetical protein
MGIVVPRFRELFTGGASARTAQFEVRTSLLDRGDSKPQRIVALVQRWSNSADFVKCSAEIQVTGIYQ